MTIEAAQIVLATITAVGFIVWLVGLQILVTAARVGKAANLPNDDLNEPASEEWLTGSAEVEGQPASLVKRAAALLAKHGPGYLVPLKIVACTDDHLAFERLDSVAAGPHWFRRGELRFTPRGRDRTRIDYVVERVAARWLLWLGALFLFLGLVALIAGSWVVYALVVSSPDPGTRWQTFQMLQAVHFLWPPFLFAAVYRRGVRSVRATFDALIHNLPYSGE
jgi:hypothetical protein